MSDIMTFDHIVKTFGDVRALDGVSFSIPDHSIFGLLGPNGAGKTTLIRIITKIFAADSGHIIFDGENISSQQYANIGYMPEEKGMYKKMKVGEHLIYLARLKGLTKEKAKQQTAYWLDRLGAHDWWNKKLEDLSKGMQQKVQFISTVIHEPKLLILDEPFSGLDPVNAELIKNEIYQLHEKGVTIIFSTHRMEQVEEICRNIALINKGRVIIDGEVKSIKNKFKQNTYAVRWAEERSVPPAPFFTITEHNASGMTVQLTQPVTGNALLHYFIEQQVEITAFYEILPTLNDIFIQLVNQVNHEQDLAHH